MKPKAVDQPEMRQVEQRLAVVLEKERRDAIGYAVLTVLCTPFFVVMMSLAVMLVMALIFRHSDCYANAKTLYTFINIFLGSMAVFALRRSNPPENPHDFDLTWLAGVGVLLGLLFVTYATSFLERAPRAFAAFYTVVGFLILALFGRVYMKVPVVQDVGDDGPIRSLTLIIFGFVAMAYGEIASGSWLWIPPDEDKIRIAAWILCKLALEESWPLDSRSADRPILDILFRLKYIQVKDDKLQLTYRGYDFVTAASRDEYAVE